MRVFQFHAPLWVVACLVLGCSVAPPREGPGSSSGAPAPQRARIPKPDSDLEKKWHSVCEDVLGRPYRFGGGGREGFDCSGLVRHAYRQFDGRSLPRTTGDLYRFGHAVSSGRISTGDLLFYRTNGHGVSHVGIYLWEGWFLHASNGEGVTLTRTDDPYYERRFLGARRLQP